MFQRGVKVFAKRSNCPFWPGIILAGNHELGKYEVFLYGLNESAQIKTNNIVLLNEESMETLGKPKTSRSKWKDAFSSAMLELQANPDLPMLEIGPNNNPILPEAPDDLTSDDSPNRPFEFLTGRATVKRVPKASRDRAAAALTETLVQVLAAPNDLEAWRGLLQFAGICFGKPKRGGKKGKME